MIVAEFATAAIPWTSTTVLYAGINSERPDASPSGDAIAFEQEHGAFQSAPSIDIVVFRPATLSLKPITRGDGEYIQAAWSPDGSKIAFACAKHRAELQICTSDVNGTNERVLTHGRGSHEWPAWSPDDRHLAYFLGVVKDGKIDASIGVVDEDGRNEHLITAHAGVRRDETPSWSSDGKRIVFQTDRLGAGFRIAIMNPDGSDVRMLTR